MKRKLVVDEFKSTESPHSSRNKLHSVREDSYDEIDEIQTETPSKFAKKQVNGTSRTQRISQLGNGSEDEISEQVGRESFVDEKIDELTPGKKARGRPKGSRTKSKGLEIRSPLRKPLIGKALFSTPTKPKEKPVESATPSISRNTDRSARRKSARTLIQKTVTDNFSDDEEEDLARDIYDNDDEDELQEFGGLGEDDEAPEMAPETPSKRGRGRPKGSGKSKGSKSSKRSPTPPHSLPPHELYFSQNRGGGSKTSNNTISSLVLLDHEEYFTLTRAYKDPHDDDMTFLQNLHARSFSQWQFEMSQSFNICLYGWGSKRLLLTTFATYTYNSHPDRARPKIVVVNGYIPTITTRDILNTLASALPTPSTKLGAQPTEMLETLCCLLEEEPLEHIMLIIHSIDASPLRRAATQTLLSRLASHPQISLIASADHPLFPLLWDSSLRSTFNFIFHDCTTFRPYSTEVDVVNEVHELLGRSGRRVGGRDGISFVLKSLPQNAKNLFRVLVAEQLAGLEDGDSGLDVGENDIEAQGEDFEARLRTGRMGEVGVEYKLLYQKAVEDFICGDEVSFRTLLKEFHDHQMIHSRKDAMGTEMLSVPFRKEELETILEGLMA